LAAKKLSLFRSWPDLPANKLHYSNLGAKALTLAIKNYQEKGQKT
jgi:hypothetical protein